MGKKLRTFKPLIATISREMIYYIAEEKDHMFHVCFTKKETKPVYA